MEVQKLLRAYRKELDDVIQKYLPQKNKIIEIQNLDEYHEYLKTIEFQTKHGKTVAFTNGNGWYVPTLIRNLLKSKNIHETYDFKLGVICSDKKAFELCPENNIENSFLVNIPLLKVDTLTEIRKKTDYNRLVYVKTVSIYHALKLGYTVIYLDPDMAFNQPSMAYIIDKIDEHGLVLAGFKEGNMNTNIIGVIPNDNNVNLFEMDYNTIEASLINGELRKGSFICGDEEVLMMKFSYYKPDTIHFLDTKLFPPGNHIDKATDIKITHANGVSGLFNKITFLQKHNSWFLW